MKTLIGAAVLAAFGLSAEASDQLRLSVRHELPRYGVEVDVRSLSTAQLAAIHHILHSDHSHSEKRGLIRSAVGGAHSLRGLLLGR